MEQHKNHVQLEHIYSQAVEYHSQGHVDQAIDLYKQLLTHCPQSDVLQYNYGLALYESGNFVRAKEAFSTAASLNEKEADYWFNLGLTCKQLGLLVDAVSAYKNALKIHPEDQEVLYNLGCCCLDIGAFDEAAHCYEHVLEIDPEYLPALNNLAYVYHRKDQHKLAQQAYRKVIALDPSHESARFMTSALEGKPEASPPAAYVRDLFDNYSESFEEELLETLNYQVPERMFSFFNQNIAKPSFTHMLDLGCGTGLCGQVFQPVAAKITGVDLSPQMLSQAREKKCYDTLEEAELVQFLKKTKMFYDLFIAADVLIYLGDLTAFFSALVSKSLPKALFLFSVETAKGCEEWALQPTGRYAHSHEYILSLTAENNLELLGHESTPLRKERDQWIDGALYLFKI